MTQSPGTSNTEALALPQDLVRQLGGCVEALPEALRRQLLAAGAAIVPALITLVEQALTDHHAALGWAPLHAVDLLGAMGDPRAVPVLLRCLDEDDESDLLDQRVVTALRVLGAGALDACVTAYATTPRDPFRDRVAGVLSRWGSHDERIYAVLVDTLQRTPELGANYLVDYGDVRALDVLAQTFDALPIRAGENPLANHVFIELRCAIEDLGGRLTATQQHWHSPWVTYCTQELNRMQRRPAQRRVVVRERLLHQRDQGRHDRGARGQQLPPERLGQRLGAETELSHEVLR